MILVVDKRGRVTSRQLFKPGVAYEFDPAGRFHELDRKPQKHTRHLGRIVTLASGLKVWEGGNFNEDPADVAVRHRELD